MLEMGLSPATVIIALALIALVVLSVRRIRKKGACECAGGCVRKEAGCAGCSAADKMVANLDATAKDERR